MSEIQTLDVTIMGREFRVACPDQEKQGLQDAVAYLDRKMREIRDSGKVIGIERIAIMAALNISHELLSTKVAGSMDLGDVKRKLQDMQNAIHQAMTEQSELF